MCSVHVHICIYNKAPEFILDYLFDLGISYFIQTWWVRSENGLQVIIQDIGWHRGLSIVSGGMQHCVIPPTYNRAFSLTCPPIWPSDCTDWPGYPGQSHIIIIRLNHEWRSTWQGWIQDFKIEGGGGAKDVQRDIVGALWCSGSRSRLSSQRVGVRIPLGAYALRQGILSTIVSLDPGVVNGYPAGIYSFECS